MSDTNAQIEIDDETFEMLEAIANGRDDARGLAERCGIDPLEFKGFMDEYGLSQNPEALELLTSANDIKSAEFEMMMNEYGRLLESGEPAPPTSADEIESASDTQKRPRRIIYGLTYLRSPRRPAHEKFRKELEDLLSRVKGNWGSELRPLLDLRQRLRSVLIELDTAISLIRSQRPEPVITVAPVDLFGHYQGHSHYVDSSFAFTYPVKITEDKKSVHVACNFAGAHHEDLEVTLRDNVLTIACEVKDQKPVQTPSDAQRLIVGKYQRSMVVPSTVDQSKIEANFKDGVLSVELPKSADVQSDVRYIPVLWPGTTRY